MTILYERNSYDGLGMALLIALTLLTGMIIIASSMIKDKSKEGVVPLSVTTGLFIFVIFISVLLWNNPSKIVTATITEDVTWSEMKNYKVISHKGDLWELEVLDNERTIDHR